MKELEDMSSSTGIRARIASKEAQVLLDDFYAILLPAYKQAGVRQDSLWMSKRAGKIETACVGIILKGKGSYSYPMT